MPKKRRRRYAKSSILARGEPMVWLTGGSLVLCVGMIISLIALILYQGGTTFWPGKILSFKTVNGTVVQGEITRSSSVTYTPEIISGLDPKTKEKVEAEVAKGNKTGHRRLVRTGNFDLTNTHFEWIDNNSIQEEQEPEWLVLLERRSWGRFYGIPKALKRNDEVIAEGPEATWKAFQENHTEVYEGVERFIGVQKYDFGRIHKSLEKSRLRLKSIELEHGIESAEYREGQKKLQEETNATKSEEARLNEELALLKKKNSELTMTLVTAGGQEATVPLAEIVRGVASNQLNTSGRLGLYFERWWEFLFDDPREANSEGGIWPALVGTVIMTLLMSAAVVPFGILAALYLREYAKAGFVVSTIRIAINNLAGVPSIVFGVFGLGFFCYIVGSGIDEMFFQENLPNPTYGKGGVLWASATLALLTLPVVIVATEEAIAAVPGSMREGSYACGASKWQTIQRIVLPRALPGIMTGFILAMARGAGEVAPLMLVGVVKLAPELPIDSVAPFLHPERSFMHLGFHIYDVGFQSQNSEAAKPMVYTTTLLLISIIAGLNLVAIWVRGRLRRRFIKTEI